LKPTLAGLANVVPLSASQPGSLQLDRGYDNGPTRALLDELGLDGVIARKGVPAPLQAGSRWTVEIILSQLTKPCVEAPLGGRDHVADLHVVVGDHDAVNQELD
jgi:hypothetical protein